MALTFYHMRLYDKCLAAIAEEKKYGSTYQILHLEGLALRALNRISEAISAFFAAQKLNPLDISIAQELASCFYLQGDYQSVITQCDNVIMANEQAPWPIHQLRGLAAFHTGDTTAAKEHLFRAYDLHPTLQVKELIGEMQNALGMYHEAIATMNDVIALSPEAVFVLIELGLLYVKVNSMEHAFECFSRAAITVQKQLSCRNSMALGRSTEPFAFSMAFFSLGYVIQTKDPRTALLKYRVSAGLKEDNRDPHLWANLAYVFISLSNLEAALACAVRAFKLNSTSEPCRRVLGHVYICIEDYSRAFQVLSAIMGNVHAYESQWLLGIAAAKLGEMKIAISCLFKATEGGLYGACLAGLLICLQENDLTTASQFSVRLKEMDPENKENLRQGKAAIKRLRSLLIREQGEGQVEEEAAAAVQAS